ncbi:DUF488 family protein [Shimwellia pseudoproteus]|uniref:DUF488 domain-containing protein n=1 Tax=Shimwellia pseudoproteus TaxID=570012 RepID=UPI0018EC5762|nr:DUF488 family protein [Shimwellia pseudoproteus]MBJ3813929.1 DUF488 family protein [Shimwellia pseudoproteus]
MIRCKRVYDAPAADDGYRVLVDKLWPRGIKKEALHYDEWCKSLTPSSPIRQQWHREIIDFAGFRALYRQELAGNPDLDRLARISEQQPLTLLYGAKNTHQNHALVLAEMIAGRLSPTPA